MKKVFVAGHRGLVGSATCIALQAHGGVQVITRTHAELNLADRAATLAFFRETRPDQVVMCAAKVGGIFANARFPVDFLHDNLLIQLSVFEAAHATGIDRMIFLGSSCIYPRDCPQPIREEYLLTGSLEPTNRPYALAKIAGVESSWSYNRQYATKYLALMPTNMYGPGDNYHPEHSHVLPALLRRFHAAKVNSESSVVVWGSGSPRREFMYSADLGAAIVYLLGVSDAEFNKVTNPSSAPLINVGVGEDITIKELAALVKATVGYSGDVVFDASKPDGTPRKLLDVQRIHDMGWRAKTPLVEGLRMAYTDYIDHYAQHASLA